MGTTSVDPAALQAAAQRLDTAADIVLGTLRTRLADLQFDGAVAGRAHGRAGDAVRTGVDTVVAGLARWAAAARETSAALRAGAQGYSDAESRAQSALR
jgi:hypothetical protein